MHFLTVMSENARKKTVKNVSNVVDKVSWSYVIGVCRLFNVNTLKMNISNNNNINHHQVNISKPGPGPYDNHKSLLPS